MREDQPGGLVFRQVRAAIRMGDIRRAEVLLNSCGGRNAEWYFLMGAVYDRKGWLDEAQRHYDAAASLEPGNSEYRQAAKRMRGGARYHPQGKSVGTLCAEGACAGLAGAWVLCQVGSCCACCGGSAVCCRCIQGIPH